MTIATTSYGQWDLCGGVAKVAGARLGTEATDAMFRALAGLRSPYVPAGHGPGCFQLCVELRLNWPPMAFGTLQRCSPRLVATHRRRECGAA